MKTNIGIKDGRIVGIGRAGNPDITAGVDLTIGPNTLPVMGYGLIATAGAIDSHVHLITPELVAPALSAGVTTLITAGFEEPPANMARPIRGVRGVPGEPRPAGERALRERGGRRARDRGRRRRAEDPRGLGRLPRDHRRDAPLADAHDIAVCLHTDGLNESCELEDTVAAIDGRAVHAYHVEGVGGGHVPDLIGLVREPNIVCSSTTPTVPYGTHTAAEHLAMILLVHGGSIDSPDDVAAARERIHEGTMAAEGPLHDLGAISIVNSDSQGMGRIGETVRRTFQLAHAMKAWRATEAGQAAGPAQTTPTTTTRACSAISPSSRPSRPACTASRTRSASSGPGRLADVVLWRPAPFGVRPELVLKAGYWAWGALGEGNASVELAEPVRYRPHWGALGNAAASLATTFVSQAALDAGFAQRLGTRRRVVAVHGTRTVRRDGLVANTATAADRGRPGRRDRHGWTVACWHRRRPPTCRSTAATC